MPLYAPMVVRQLTSPHDSPVIPPMTAMSWLHVVHDLQSYTVSHLSFFLTNFFLAITPLC